MLSKLEEGDEIFETQPKGLYWVSEFDDGGDETGGQFFETLDGATEYIKEIENSLLEESSMVDDEELFD